jgi:hypothetical protein
MKILAYPTEKERVRTEARNPKPYSNSHAYKPLSRGGTGGGGGGGGGGGDSPRAYRRRDLDDSEEDELLNGHGGVRHEDDDDAEETTLDEDRDRFEESNSKKSSKSRPAPVKRGGNHVNFRSRVNTGLSREEEEEESDDDRLSWLTYCMLLYLDMKMLLL